MTAGQEDREHWDRAASTYDAEYREWLSEAFENKIRSWLARWFTPDDDVLELGCGTGIFSEMIVGQVRHLTATDFSPEMLDRAGERLTFSPLAPGRPARCSCSIRASSTVALVLISGANICQVGVCGGGRNSSS